jgi:hypothetical protein
MSNDKDKIVLLQLQLELSREETKRKHEEEETKRKHEEEETKRKREEEETKRNLAQIALQRLKLEGTFVIYYIFHIFLFLFYILIEPVRRQISLNDILKRKIHEPKEEIIKKMFTRFEVRVNNILLTDYINNILLLLCNNDMIDWKEQLDNINKKCEEIYKL